MKWKWFEKTFLPESNKKIWATAIGTVLGGGIGGLAGGGTLGGFLAGSATGGAAGAALDVSKSEASTPNPDPTGVLDSEEAQRLANLRLAKIGKYFTSPLGLLNKANSQSQKVFS